MSTFVLVISKSPVYIKHETTFVNKDINPAHKPFLEAVYANSATKATRTASIVAFRTTLDTLLSKLSTFT